MENYESFSHSLKSNYPRIIVDVLSILHRGIDTNGTKVNPISVGKYYQSRKHQATMSEEKRLEKTSTTVMTTTTATTAAAIHKEKIPLSNDELVERLVHITNRDRKELQKSIERLPYSDLKKISQLSRNYSKLERYSKLITKEQLKNEIQREIGRELRSHEIVRAANSVRRARSYIENILDNKFMPDASHGINHIKHNLEYGYRLMNLIELPRRRPRAQ
jgi:carboxypeptidase C (cathepsin A)